MLHNVSMRELGQRFVEMFVPGSPLTPLDLQSPSLAALCLYLLHLTLFLLHTGTKGGRWKMTRRRGIDAVVILAWIPGRSLSLS